jgi:hypothetical protein
MLRKTTKNIASRGDCYSNDKNCTGKNETREKCEQTEKIKYITELELICVFVQSVYIESSASMNLIPNFYAYFCYNPHITFVYVYFLVSCV